MRLPKGCEVVPLRDVREHVEGLDGGYDGNVVFAKQAVVWPGDLELDRPAKKDKENIVGLVFSKDLTVKQDIVNADSDSGRFLVVKGKLVARNIIAGGAEIVVSKAATASGLVFAFYNHGTLRVGETLRAKALINDAHDLDVDGETEAITICADARNDMLEPDFVYEDLPRIVVKTVLDKQGGVDDKKLIAALRKGTNVLIAGAKPSREHQAAELAKLAARKPVRLDLSEKSSKVIPASVWKMADLEELVLGGYELEKLPADIGKLVGLRSLSLKGTSITKLPADLGKLPALETLVLYRTAIAELPAALVKRNALKRLVLVVYAQLPGGTEQLTNLEELVIDGSPDSPDRAMKTIPSAIAKLSKLRVLDLISNPLAALPGALEQLTNLEELRLRYALGSVETLPDLSKLSKLRVLHFYGRGGGPRAPVASLLETMLTFELPLLEELDLTGWKKITPAQLARVARYQKLRSLNLSACGLTRVPDEILALPALESLQLTDNQLDAAEQRRVFAALPNARLDLRSQKLPEVPDSPEHKAARDLVSAGRAAVTSSYDFATAIEHIDAAIAILDKLDDPRARLSAYFAKLGVYSTYVDSKKAGYAEAKQRQTELCWKCIEQCTLAGQTRRLTDDIVYQNEVLRQCANHLALQLTAKAKPAAADLAQAVSLIERAAATLDGDSNRYIRATHAQVLLKANRETDAWAVVRAAYDASAGNEDLAKLKKDKRYVKWSQS